MKSLDPTRLAAALALLVGACGAPERPAPVAPRPPATSEPAATEVPLAPLTYVLADPDALPPSRVTEVGPGTLGVLIDGVRAVISPAGTSVARELTSPSLTGVTRIPPWLGGGFLFETASSLYTSDAFDGPLRPLVAFRSNIQPPVFGPKGLFVRGTSGERWGIELPGGARSSPAPLGLVDLVALGDGRVAALTEAGGAFASVDRGEHWIDVAPALSSPVAAVVVVEEQPFFKLWSGRAVRLEKTGKLSEVAALPAPPRKPLLPKDPRWHGSEPPLRAAIHRGAPSGDGAAVVIVGGDVVRVDLRSGALLSVQPGRLPPDLPCEPIRSRETLLFFCGAPGRPSIVASLSSADAPPKIEKTFTSDGSMVYASDDGLVAFRGPCSGDGPAPTTACVRDERGEWTDATLEGSLVGAPDAAAQVTDVARWIPRPGGEALAIVTAPALAILDSRTGKSRLLRTDDVAPQTLERLRRALAVRSRDHNVLVDRAWSTTPRGGIRGWLDDGQSVEIDADGGVKISAYTFGRVAMNGLFALARSNEGRAFQTTDGGASWTEVGPPPTANGASSFEPQRCSAVGCDVGAWARIGWDPTGPDALAPPFMAAPAPLVPATPLVDVTCVPAGELKVAALAPSPEGQDDLGLGAMRVPFSRELENGRSIAYDRHFYSRTPSNPAHGTTSEDDGAPRAMIHGYVAQLQPIYDAKGATRQVVDVLGPRRDAGAFERKVSFSAPFDPGGEVRTVSFGMNAISSAGKGLALSQLLVQSGVFEATPPVPVTPLDPAASGGLTFQITGEPMDLIAIVTAGSTPAIRLGWPHPRQRQIVSAVEVGKDELAVLAESDGGGDHVFKLTKGGISDLAELPTPPTSDAYPANPDAIAVGPQGALAILRTPSGPEPPSSLDPALLFPLGGRPIALAPWSTLTSADDPACRGDAAGFRATLHTVGSWVRVRGPRAVDDPASMLARVRWSTTRVCLEALETRESVQEQQNGESFEVWIAARFVAPAAAGRVAVSRGSERHQPMTCTLVRR